MVRTRRKSSKSSFSRKAGKPAVKRAAPKRAGNNAADTEAVMRMWLMLWAFLLIGQVKKTISCRSAPPPIRAPIGWGAVQCMTVRTH